MYTFQDLQAKRTELERIDFVKSAIDSHKTTQIYKTAIDAEEYAAHRNTTIRKYQRLLYSVSGKAFPDKWGANFKMACRHFSRFITQEVQFLLGNGTQWENESTATALGTKKQPFDNQLQKLALKALKGGVSFGFYNRDHIDVFGITEFVPLYDEIDGTLKAGIRFWQVETGKPFHAKLYEIDGFTDIIFYTPTDTIGEGWNIIDSGKAERAKRFYKYNVNVSEADGEEINNGENYPSFPIVPLFGNPEKQSELVGLKEEIDCYDLIRSGYANTVDEASIVYWTLTNAGGMDDIDLAQFVERLKTVHAATTTDDVQPESHTLEAPYQSREALLERLDRDLYRDAMALDTNRIAAGATTATQIRAAYEPLNSKCDMFEYCVIDFIQGILEIAGIEDEPTFTRSMIVNVNEDIQSLVLAAPNLTQEYVTEKILTLLGDKDRAAEIIGQMQTENLPTITIEE
jgi:hypothetical protein